MFVQERQVRFTRKMWTVIPFIRNVINFPETSRDRTNLIFTFCNEFGSDSPISKLISNPFYMAKLIFMA